MDHRSPAFEATLLYNSNSDYEYSVLTKDIEDLFHDYDETVCFVDKVDAVYVLITTERLKVLLALGNDSLPIDGFLSADRPAATQHNDTEILGKLLAISATTTVLILPRDDIPATAQTFSDHAMSALCWDIVACVHATIPAELVFWSDTETLYTAQEFERACTYAAAQTQFDSLNADPAPDVLEDETLQELFHREPEVNATMDTWLAARDEADPEAADSGQEAIARNRWLDLLWPRKLAGQGSNVPAGGLSALKQDKTEATFTGTNSGVWVQ